MAPRNSTVERLAARETQLQGADRRPAETAGSGQRLGGRQELATELDCPADLMGDSANMNSWLHKTVMQKSDDNGGKVPKEILR